MAPKRKRILPELSVAVLNVADAKINNDKFQTNIAGLASDVMVGVQDDPITKQMPVFKFGFKRPLIHRW